MSTTMYNMTLMIQLKIKTMKTLKKPGQRTKMKKMKTLKATTQMKKNKKLSERKPVQPYVNQTG